MGEGRLLIKKTPKKLVEKVGVVYPPCKLTASLPHDYFFKIFPWKIQAPNGAKLSESCVFGPASSVFMRILLGGFLPMSSSKWLPSW